MGPDPSRIPEALKQLRETGAVTKYLWIQSHVEPNDQAFRKAFNAFYRVRQRPPSWYEAFYAGFEAWKHNRQELTFSAVLADVQHRTQRFEASFSSKLVSVLDPHSPVWDSKLLEYWALKRPRTGAPIDSVPLSRSTKRCAIG